MKTLPFMAAVAIVASPAFGQTVTADHNGSAMRIEREGSRVRIVYDAPRPGLREAGVMPGMIVFEGVQTGDKLAGRAFAFKRGCQPAGYDVAGSIAGDRIELNGPGPKRSGCAVVSLDAGSPHSFLAFNGKAGSVAALSEDASRPRTGLEMRAAIQPSPAPVAPQPVQPEPPKASASLPSLPPVVEAEAPRMAVPALPVAPEARTATEPTRPIAPPVQATIPAKVEAPSTAPAPLPTASNPKPVEEPARPKKPKLDADL